MTQYKSEADRNVRRAFIENCRDMGRGHIIDVRHLGPRTWWYYVKPVLLTLAVLVVVGMVGYALLHNPRL
jgi:hypothetical protein